MTTDGRPNLSGLEEYKVGEREILEMAGLDGAAKGARPNLACDVECDGKVFLGFKDRRTTRKVVIVIDPSQVARLAGMLCMAADGNDSKGNFDGEVDVS